MNRADFYKSLKRRNSGVFGTSISQGQVNGCEAILDECAALRVDIGKTAYILATGYGETGGKMQSVRENLNYSAAQIAKHFGAHRRQGKSPRQLARNPRLLGNTVYGGPWGKKNLGNIKPNDGYDFRGFWVGQITGRRNAERAGRDLGLDLVGNPALLDRQGLGGKLMVRWMLNGRATGRSLGEYINAKQRDYHGARAVWGGVDAAKYVTLARSFETALKAGGYSPALTPSKPKPAPTPTPRPTGGFWAFLAALFGRKNR